MTAIYVTRKNKELFDDARKVFCLQDNITHENFASVVPDVVIKTKEQACVCKKLFEVFFEMKQWDEVEKLITMGLDLYGEVPCILAECFDTVQSCAHADSGDCTSECIVHHILIPFLSHNMVLFCFLGDDADRTNIFGRVLQTHHVKLITSTLRDCDVLEDMDKKRDSQLFKFVLDKHGVFSECYQRWHIFLTVVRSVGTCSRKARFLRSVFDAKGTPLFHKLLLEDIDGTLDFSEFDINVQHQVTGETVLFELLRGHTCVIDPSRSRHDFDPCTSVHKVMKLLDHDCDLDVCDKKGRPFYHYVSCVLSSWKIIPRRVVNGIPYLHLMAATGCTEAIVELFDEESSELDINYKDDNGTTAFMVACSYGKYSTAKALKERGCDVTLRDRHDRSAVFYTPPTKEALELFEDKISYREVDARGYGPFGHLFTDEFEGYGHLRGKLQPLPNDRRADHDHYRFKLIVGEFFVDKKLIFPDPGHRNLIELYLQKYYEHYAEDDWTFELTADNTKNLRSFYDDTIEDQSPIERLINAGYVDTSDDGDKGLPARMIEKGCFGIAEYLIARKFTKRGVIEACLDNQLYPQLRIYLDYFERSDVDVEDPLKMLFKSTSRTDAVYDILDIEAHDDVLVENLFCNMHIEPKCILLPGIVWQLQDLGFHLVDVPGILELARKNNVPEKVVRVLSRLMTGTTACKKSKNSST